MLRGLHDKVAHFFISYVMLDADNDRARTIDEARQAAHEIADAFAYIATGKKVANSENQSSRAIDLRGENGTGENGTIPEHPASHGADSGSASESNLPHIHSGNETNPTE